MRPDDPRCGTEAGHEQHYRDGDDHCEPCYQAKLVAARRRTKRKTMGYRYTVPSDRARARIQRWREGGATYGEIADHVEVEESRVWEIINCDSATIYTRTANKILAANGWPVTAASLTRRVRALTRLGWSLPAIAEAAGAHRDTVNDLRVRVPEFAARKVRAGIVKAFDELAMRLPEPATQQERAGVTRARNFAERNGWPPPLAWDDIDDPNERPQLTDAPRAKTDLDHAVVERVIRGERLSMTRAERLEVVRRLRDDWGWSEDRIETHTGISKSTNRDRYPTRPQEDAA